MVLKSSCKIDDVTRQKITLVLTVLPIVCNPVGPGLWVTTLFCPQKLLDGTHRRIQVLSKGQSETNISNIRYVLHQEGYFEADLVSVATGGGTVLVTAAGTITMQDATVGLVPVALVTSVKSKSAVGVLASNVTHWLITRRMVRP